MIILQKLLLPLTGEMGNGRNEPGTFGKKWG
jgi:hypothetical protein